MHDLNLISLGWFFFTAWTIIVAALSLKVFGSDLLREFVNSPAARDRKS